MQFFGPSWGAPVKQDVEQVPTPVGQRCPACKDLIQDGQQGYLIPYLPAEGEATVLAWHRKCFEAGFNFSGPH